MERLAILENAGVGPLGRIVRSLVSLPLWVAPATVAALTFATLAFVDTTPQVSADFFFASDDPSLASSRAIESAFPSREQILLSVEGDLHSSAYLERLRELSERLSELPGVDGVRSLANGPADVEEALESPLWRPLLIGPAAADSLVILLLGEASAAELVPAVEAVVARATSGDFRIRVSGVPYVMVSMQRALIDDLRTVNLAAVLVIAALVLVAYRSVPLLVGALLSCGGGVLATLLTQSLVGIPVGLLTANLAAIVVVLTLTHVVFLTNNWRRSSAESDSIDAPALAISTTVSASFWAMVSTVVGFASLLSVSAEPLKQLGGAGALGTLCAFAAAYGLFPAYLRLSTAGVSPAQTKPFTPSRAASGLAACGVALGVVVIGLGASNLRADPSLLEYFQSDGEIRSGLEHFDERGGAGILKLVVANQDERPLDNKDSYERLWAVHQQVKRHPAVGVPLSLPLLMAEGDRHPLSFLVTWARMLKLMGSQDIDGGARSFVTADHRSALFVVRMLESYRDTTRTQVLDEVRQIPPRYGFEVQNVGGIYLMQARLAEQVESSLYTGLALVLGAFSVVGAFAAGSMLAGALMAGALGAIALCVLGVFGWSGMPLGIIAAPGLNIGLGIAVDGMIHLARARKRVRGWRAALDEQRPGILWSAVIVVLGFAVLLLSNFPPNQRLAIAVMVGTLTATLMLLVLLPAVLGARQAHDGEPS